MKSIFLLLFIFFVACSNERMQKSQLQPKELSTLFASIDDPEVLSVLFPNAKVKGDHILWGLDYNDIDYFKELVSYDSLCHTTIDTILSSKDKYFVILRTDAYDTNGVHGCHMCSPVVGIASFEKTKEGYQLLNFKRKVFQLGQFGHYGRIALDTLCIPVIKVTSGWFGSGTQIDYEFYYDQSDFRFIYHLTTLYSNVGDYADDEPHFFEYTQQIVNKTDTSFVIESIDKRIDSIQGRLISKKKMLVTFYDEYGGKNIRTLVPVNEMPKLP